MMQAIGLQYNNATTLPRALRPGLAGMIQAVGLNSGSLSILGLSSGSAFDVRGFAPAFFGLRPSDLLHRIHQRCQPMNPHLEPITRFNRPNPAWRSGKNNIAGQQRHVRRNEAYQLEAVED